MNNENKNNHRRDERGKERRTIRAGRPQAQYIECGETHNLSDLIGETNSGEPIEMGALAGFDPETGATLMNGKVTGAEPDFRPLDRDVRTEQDALLAIIEAYVQFRTEIAAGRVKNLRRVDFISDVDAVARKVFRGNDTLLERFQQFAAFYEWWFLTLRGKAPSAKALKRIYDNPLASDTGGDWVADASKAITGVSFLPSTIPLFCELLVPELIVRGLFPVEKYFRRVKKGRVKE